MSASSSHRPRAALFDMDRTLLRCETASMYVRYQRAIGEASWKDLARAMFWVGQYTLGLFDAPKVAEKVLQELEGVPEILLSSRCDDWFRTHVERHIADAGRLCVQEHKARGDVCAIVTGATRYASRPLARILDIHHVVASELEVDGEGRFTGRAEQPLCFGEGKLTRALELSRRLGFELEEATFYTDSISDLPLLLKVREPVAVNPDPRLKREAARRGFRVVYW